MLLPFTMTLAGTFPLLLCIILWVTQKKSFSPLLGINLLKCSIFLYLVPIQWIRHLLPAKIHDLLYYRNHELLATEPMTITFKDKLQIPFFDEYLLIPYSYTFIFGLTFLIAIIFCIYEIVQYKKYLRYILQTADISDQNPDKNTKILTHPHTNIPYTIGLFRSYIVFPENTDTITDSSMLYEHEKRHVMNKDGLMKLLCLLVLCLHWYNPFVWLLVIFYNIISEYVCDVQVTDNYSDEEKRRYASLLINMASEKEPLPMVWKNNFNNSKKNIQRRIIYIMNNKKKRFFTDFSQYLPYCSVSQPAA